MYPIDFSQGRKKKEPQFAIPIPKITPRLLIAVGSVCFLLLCSVFVLDFLSKNAADAKIREMVAFAESEDGKVRTKLRKLAGVKPEMVTKGSKLYEIYTFNRTIPVFSPPTVTVVYSSSGRVLDFLSSSETALLQSGRVPE